MSDDGMMLQRIELSEENMAIASRAAILARLERLLAGLGKSAQQASTDAGLGESFIRDFRSGKSKSPTLENLASLSKALETTPEFLAFGVGASSARRRLAMIGEVAAGVWIDTDGEADTSPVIDAPVMPDPRYPADEQFAVCVRGNSIDRIAKPGAVLICVSTQHGAIAPVNGDLVIVERRRVHEDGSKEVERAARKYRKNGPFIELSPESTDPRWKPIEYAPGAEVGDMTTTVVAVVVQICRPLRTEAPPAEM